MNRVDHKTALITGASSGIGACVANVLAEAGATVLATDVDVEQGARTVAAISGRGFPATFIRHDVSSEADWVSVIDYARTRLGGLDILVNNAGIALIKPIQDTTLEEWHRLCRVNILTAYSSG